MKQKRHIPSRRARPDHPTLISEAAFYPRTTDHHDRRADRRHRATNRPIPTLSGAR
jgi:hypothetical protein